MASKRFEDGLEVRRAVLGREYVDGNLEAAKSDPHYQILQELVTEFGWGAVWARPGLERRTRSMINLGMLTALNRPHEFEIHLKGAINNGVTRDEVVEVLIQTIPYCGFPAAIDSFRIARRLFAEQDAAAGGPAATTAAPKAKAKAKAKVSAKSSSPKTGGGSRSAKK